MVKLVVGLGNPGYEYRNTRHNVGWMVLDALAERLNVGFSRSRFRGDLAEVRLDGRRVLLLKPTTYMNLSGESVSSICRFFKIEPREMLVVLDDLDLPLGKIRLRLKGGSAGHKGLISIEEHVGTSDFPRLRIGIGRPERKEDVVRFVLSPFEEDEVPKLRSAVGRAVECIERAINEGIDQKTLSYCNQGG